MNDKTELILGVIWLIVAAALLVNVFTNPDAQEINWNTETELNTAGFQIYRSNSPDGEFVLITEEYIPGKGSSLTGGSYSFTDNSALPGETYYYLLEEIEYDGTTNQHTEKIISQRVPYTTVWVITLIALITLVGIGLVFAGLKKGR